MTPESGRLWRRARERALQALYQDDLATDFERGRSDFDLYWRHFGDDDPDTRELAEGLVRRVETHRRRIDEVIERSSTNWRIDRMSRVDRGILRIATAELLEGDVPRGVVINEAIEIAKRFGAESSAAFVNGVLDRVADHLGR